MLEPLISVIIPIYKVEAYLPKCIDSALAQTYRNLEIILVDDGSPDNCGRICNEYAAKDSRIKVIHKPNGGLSDARNVGMAASTGDYISFVDSDDWLPDDSIQYLYDLLTKHNAQLAIGGRERVNDADGRILHSDFHGTEHIKVMNKLEAMRSMFHDGCASWARLYKRDVHIDVSFPAGEINEDEAIVLYVLDNCDRVVQSNHIVYHYRCREESITTSNFSAKKLDWQKHCISNLDFIHAHYPELELEAAKRCRDSLTWSLTEIALAEESFDSVKQNMLRVLKENRILFRKCEFSFPQDRIRLFLLTYAPFFYEFSIRLKRGRR